MQYKQDKICPIYKYNMEIKRFLTKNKSDGASFTPPHYQWTSVKLFLATEFYVLQRKKNSLSASCSS